MLSVGKLFVVAAILALVVGFVRLPQPHTGLTGLECVHPFKKRDLRGTWGSRHSCDNGCLNSTIPALTGNLCRCLCMERVLRKEGLAASCRQCRFSALEDFRQNIANRFGAVRYHALDQTWPPHPLPPCQNQLGD